MAPTPPRLRILSVGGNAVSAFLSWRLSATNACDVTLVWKSGFEAVAQYGISFKSKALGVERFKPRQVVRSPEEAAGTSRAPFDYVLLCVKALPDVYDLASIIESVVSPQHTCILVNTTHSLGVESYLEQRFPTNVVLSLVCGAELTQTGASEFEQSGSAEFWVGPANKNPGIPASIQSDMAEALAMTLSSGQVDCKVSPNIRQQQYERMIGPIAFQPASVIFETPNHAELLDKTGVRALITGVIDELLTIAIAQGCSFPTGFREQTINAMTQSSENQSLMYQDFTARRPMEIETFLGAPMKLAKDNGLQVPRIETLYSLLHNLNIVNQTRPQHSGPPSPAVSIAPPPRFSSAAPPRGPMNGAMMNGHGPMNGPPGRGPMRGSRAPSITGMPPPMRRGPSQTNGYNPRMMNGRGLGPRGPPPMQRRPSMEGNDLEEFSHLMLYDNMPEGHLPDAGYTDGTQTPSSGGDIALRERELMLRQRELALREQEMHMRRGGGAGVRNRMPPPSRGGDAFDDDDDDGDDFFDPMAAGGPPVPMIDPDNFDMMSVTSRRTRKAPSASQIRLNPEMGGPPGRQSRNPFNRPKMQQSRTSSRMMQDVPGPHDSLMDNPLLAYSSDRYGNVDRHNMGVESRTNSLTAERLSELQLGGVGGGAYPFAPARRASQSPGHPLSPGGRPQRISPPNGYVNGMNGSNGMNGMGGMNGNGMNGMQPRNGRPSPPGMRAPVPRHPPGHGNAVAPEQVEQQVGVSNISAKSGLQVRSLTGSASASAGSGDSSHSARIESDPSAHSSSSSLGPRAPIGVR